MDRPQAQASPGVLSHPEVLGPSGRDRAQGEATRPRRAQGEGRALEPRLPGRGVTADINLKQSSETYLGGVLIPSFPCSFKSLQISLHAKPLWKLTSVQACGLHTRVQCAPTPPHPTLRHAPRMAARVLAGNVC